MQPAATLSILVKAQGIAAAVGDLQNVDKAGRKAAGGLDRSADATKKAGSAFGSIKKVAGVATAAFGAAGVAGAVKTMVGEYRESQKVGAQTAAVLKSTAGAAGVTQRGVEKLAGSISKKTGIDDEQIQSSENMLLTFTSVRNELGKGNDIFNQATKVVTDMSVALGQSGKSSAIQLGKALNDPIKGITALQRVGVSFTADQKKQIETMVKAGDVLGAQKIILGELTKEFGGSAAAQATAGDKLKTSLGNLAEAAGGVLVPMLDKVATFMTNVINQFVEGQGIAKFIIPAFLGVATAVSTVYGVIKDLVVGFQEGNTAAVIIGTTLISLTAGFVAYKTAVLVAAGATRTMAIAQTALDAVMSANPVVLVIAALAALAVGFYIAYQKSEGFRHAIDSAWDSLGTALDWVKSRWQSLVTLLTGPVANAASSIVRTVPKIPEAIIGAISSAISFLLSVPGRIATAAYNIGVSIVNGVLTGVGNLASLLVTSIENALVTALTSLNPFSPVEHGGEKYIGKPLADGAISGWVLGSAKLPDTLSDTVRNAVERAKGTVDSLRGEFSDAWSRLAGDALSAFDAIQSQKQTPTEKLLAQLNSKEAAQQLADAVTNAQQGLVAAQAALPAAVADAQSKLADAQADYNKTVQDQADAVTAAQEALTKAQNTPGGDVAGAQRALDKATRDQAAALKDRKDAIDRAQKAIVDAQTNGQKAIVDAQKQLDDALAAQNKAALEKKAAAERKEADSLAALRRRQFSDALDALQKALGKEGATRQEAHAKIMKLFKKFGVDYKAAGDASGKFFAVGMKNSEKDVEDAAVNLSKFAHTPLRIISEDIVKNVEDAAKKAGKAVKAAAGAGGGGAAVPRVSHLPSAANIHAAKPLKLEPLKLDTSGISESFAKVTGPIKAFWDTIRGAFDWVKGNWPLLRGILGGPLSVPFDLLIQNAGAVVGALKGALDWVTSNWPQLVEILLSPMTLANTAIQTALDTTVGFFKDLPGRIVDAIKDGADAIVGAGKWIINRIIEGIQATTEAIAGAAGWLKNRVVDGIHGVVEGFTSVGTWLLNRIIDGIKTVTDALTGVGGWIKNRVVDTVHAAIDGFTDIGGWILGRVVDGIKVVTDALSGVGGWLKNRISDLVHDAKDGFVSVGSSIMGFIVDGLKSGANLLVGFVNKIIDVINMIPGVKIGHVKELAKGGTLGGDTAGGQAFQAFARGGKVTKPMAIVGEEAPGHPEYVIPTNPAYRGRALSLFGAVAKDLNVPGFAKGGVLGGVGSVLGSVGDALGDAAGGVWDLLSKGPGAFIDLLPSTSKIPDWLRGTGGWLKDQAAGFIKDKVGGIISSLTGGGDGGSLPDGGGNTMQFARMVAQAASMDAQHLPYLYGGGHGSFDGPWDCSGAVSAVLHAAGLLGSPITTDGLKVYGEAGDGKLVTIGVRGSTGRNAHTMIKLGNRYFESGSGHGAQWVGGWSGDFPIHRHPPGFAKGGVLGAAGDVLANPRATDFVGWGLRKGGMFGGIPFGGSFANGGVVPGPYGAPRMVLAHGGEVISNGSGATTIVEHHYHGPVVQDREFLAYLRRADQQHAHRNGKSAFGG